MHFLLEFIAWIGATSTYDGVTKDKRGKELAQHAIEDASINTVSEGTVMAIQGFWIALVLLLALPLFGLAFVPGIVVLNLAHHNVALIVSGIVLIPLGLWLWLKFMFAAKRWMRSKKSWQRAEEVDAARLAWKRQHGSRHYAQAQQPPMKVANLAAPRRIEN